MSACSVLSNGSKMSMRMLKRLSGAQDTKKMMVTVISIRLVFFLRSIWRDRRWEERGRLLCLVSFWHTLHTADMGAMGTMGTILATHLVYTSSTVRLGARYWMVKQRMV